MIDPEKKYKYVMTLQEKHVYVDLNFTHYTNRIGSFKYVSISKLASIYRLSDSRRYA